MPETKYARSDRFQKGITDTERLTLQCWNDMIKLWNKIQEDQKK